MSESLRGHFLIAARKLLDENFYRSVVLIVDHNEEGAMGLIVNRPSTVHVANALSEHFPLADCEELLYLGGPVHESALFILHNQSGLDLEEKPVIPGLFVGSSADAFETAVRTAAAGDPHMKYRIFCGCSGWGAGQLEAEMERGDWFHVPAQTDLVFADTSDSVWDQVRRQVHRSPDLLPDLPGEPEWN